MNAEIILKRFLPIFVLAVVVDFLVSHLLSIIIYGDLYINGFGLLHTGITLGIILAILNYKSENENKKNPNN